MNYCLLCDEHIKHVPWIKHNYHRYNPDKFIEYYHSESGYNVEDLIFEIFTFDIEEKDIRIKNLEDLTIFKGMYNYQLAKPIIDKLKVFK